MPMLDIETDDVSLREGIGGVFPSAGYGMVDMAQ